MSETRISIIVPCLNEAEFISAALETTTLAGGRAEVIVVDGGSSDGTLEIVRQSSAQLIQCPVRSRAAQMNLGAQQAKGDILLFLHADTLLPDGFEEEVLQACSDEHVVGGAFYLRFDHGHWMFGVMSALTRLNIKWITVGDHAMFFTRKVFDDLGGYPEIPLLEDLELQLRARRRGKMVRVQTPVTTSARRFLRNGVLRQMMKDACILVSYYLGRSPQQLAEVYD